MEIDVTELQFKNINFNKKYDATRNIRAKEIHKTGRACVNHVFLEKDKNDNIYKIKATARGNFDDYNVNLRLRENTVIEYSCTCPDYANGNICKHILATCMEIVNPHSPDTKVKQAQVKERKKQEGRKIFEEMMRKREEERYRREYEWKYANALSILKDYIPTSTEDIDIGNKKIDLQKIYTDTLNKKNSKVKVSDKLQTNIMIEPRIILKEQPDDIEVSFKIGETTMYALKDILEFYENFRDQKVVEFGKKLRFKACKESFNEQDQKMLDFILEYGKFLEYQSKLNNSKSRYYYGGIKSKSIQILTDKIDSFFDIIKDREIPVESFTNRDSIYDFTDKKLELKLEMKQNNDTINKKEHNHEDNFGSYYYDDFGHYKYTDECYLELNIRNYDYITSPKHIYVLHDDLIYTIDNNDTNSNLLRTFQLEDRIIVPDDKKDEFSTYVLPKFGEYMFDSSDDTENSELKSLVNNKLVTKVYLDLDNRGNIKLKLGFCYGDNEFNILDSEHEKYVKDNNIQRDIIGEKKVLEKIFLDGFEIDSEKSNEWFMLKDEDDIYDFLMENLEGYMNEYEVLVTDKFKARNISKVKLNNISIKLESNLLEVDMSKVDINMDEMKKILQSYNIKKRYYKLKNGNFLQLEQNKDLDFLNDMSNNLDVDFSKINNGVIVLPPSRSVYLEKMLSKNKEISVSKNDNYNNLINNINDKNFSDNIVISKNFDKVLRPYQKVGYKWLKVLENYKFGGILADDMGLGKTLEIISLLETSIKSKEKIPSIVVCPSSLVLNWNAEIEKWCNKIKVLVIRGAATDRKTLLKGYKKFDLLITSYDLLKRDILEYENKSFKYIIADEAQYIKNFSTQNATALKSLKGEIKFALTGTPIENSISELWSIFDFIMPGYLYTYNKFKKIFEEPILKNEDQKALEKLKSLIEPFVLRRIKKDVLTELPDKNITILKNEMEKEQEKLYYSYMAQIKKEVSEELNENGFEKSKLKILMLLTRLRQICCHPSLFIENYKGESGKLNQCLDILKEAISSGHRILLFSQYTSMFEIIEKEFNMLGIKYYKLVGSTPIDKRLSMVESFNKNEDVKVFLISLKAGGTGLNLTGADVVVHYDPWWNLSSENQATDRAYRIGQKNSVQVYKLITSNSIEEKISKLQEKKAKLSEQLLSTEETFINKLSKEEIMSLFE